MSDFFGIGPAILSGMDVYFTTARGTGRTTRLVESLKDGDRVVFADHREAERVRRLCLGRGVNVECITVPVENPHAAYRRGLPKNGRTIFDHTWVERYYMRGLNRMQAEIATMEMEMSTEGREVLDPVKVNWKSHTEVKW